MTDFATIADSLPADAPFAPLDRSADLQTVLAAWHAATLRLEQTHETLRAEVERLRGELEVKNRELARKNRLADLGRMAAHIAHEVRNSLVPVSLYLSLLRRRVQDDAESLVVLEQVEAGTLALDTTVNDLLHFTSQRDPQRTACPLRPLVDEIYASLAPQFAAQAISAHVEVAADATAHADRSMLRRALLNLVLNALDAMRGGGELVVSARAVAGGVELAVADRGEGLSAEAERRAFEPFFSTKSSGTGLGLSIVERVAESHGGTVTAVNRSGGGACLTLFLPNRPAGDSSQTSSAERAA